MVSRGVCWDTEFDLVFYFFALRLSAFRSEITRCEMIPDMLVVNVFAAVSHARPSDFWLRLGF